MGLIGRIVGSFIEDTVRIISTEVYEGYTKPSKQIAPPGIDANPIDEDQGVLIPVDNSSGKNVQIGIYNISVVDKGEIRIYSRDASGEVKAVLFCKKDGTIEVNGNTDFAVAYTDLKIAFDLMKTEINALITAYNLHAHESIAGVPLPLTGISKAPGTPITADMTAAKVDEVKLP